ncbi:MAG TPA: serine/threonine-protein kinase [Gaiellaceae bacterium]|nr:serine/threonine-protein kinase [Gaiellaceae bacterium]
MPDELIAGRYRLESLLGRGGMSEVWRAHDQELGRTVAIKLLAAHADQQRFEREARAFAALGHPNITQLYDYGEDAGRPYMVLEYVPGGTLEEQLRDRHPLDDERTAAIAAGIAAGLAHAHARGVVHRDLKPANVLFDEEGRPKLTDYGIARLAAGEGTLTEAGTVLGTAAYISPEQAAGLPATTASDVYSFGIILYRMLTGRLPFESTDPMELVLQHRDATPPPISSLRPDAPARLESTAMAAIAKDPRDRPQDGGALLAELGAPAAGLTTSATAVLARDDRTQVMPAAPPRPAYEPVPPAPAPPPRSRAPLVVTGLAILALGGAALAYAVTRPSSSPADTGTVAPVTLPRQSTSQPTSTSTPATTEQTTTAATTAPTTTEQTTRQQTTTAAPPPTTVAPPPTTTIAPPTTAPPTTTATLPPTTVVTTATVP